MFSVQCVTMLEVGVDRQVEVCLDRQVEVCLDRQAIPTIIVLDEMEQMR